MRFTLTRPFGPPSPGGRGTRFDSISYSNVQTPVPSLKSFARGCARFTRLTPGYFPFTPSAWSPTVSPHAILTASYGIPPQRNPQALRPHGDGPPIRSDPP